MKVQVKDFSNSISDELSTFFLVHMGAIRSNIEAAHQYCRKGFKLEPVILRIVLPCAKSEQLFFLSDKNAKEVTLNSNFGYSCIALFV